MGRSLPSFTDELERFGPKGSNSAPTLQAARAYTWQLATGHYENFPVVSILVPRRLRQDFANVYAYCRWSDDLADEVGNSTKSLELLEWWKTQLDECFAGRAKHPVFVSLIDTVERFQIPKQPFVDLIEAFRQDQIQNRYANFADLRAYCRGSADPVGRIVLYLGEAWTDERAILSDYICTGLQLVNFWQDVGIDVNKGRIYLPADEMARYGVTESDVFANQITPAMRQLLEFEVERAREFLEIGRPLAREMPTGLQTAIAMFAEGGLTICRKLAKVGYNVFERRPRLRKLDGPGIVIRAWFQPWIDNLLKD